MATLWWIGYHYKLVDYVTRSEEVSRSGSSGLEKIMRTMVSLGCPIQKPFFTTHIADRQCLQAKSLLPTKPLGWAGPARHNTTLGQVTLLTKVGTIRYTNMVLNNSRHPCGGYVQHHIDSQFVRCISDSIDEFPWPSIGPKFSAIIAKRIIRSSTRSNKAIPLTRPEPINCCRIEAPACAPTCQHVSSFI